MKIFIFFLLMHICFINFYLYGDDLNMDYSSKYNLSLFISNLNNERDIVFYHSRKKLFWNRKKKYLVYYVYRAERKNISKICEYIIANYIKYDEFVSVDIYFYENFERTKGEFKKINLQKHISLIFDSTE